MKDNIRGTYVELIKGNVRPIYTEVNSERKLDVAIRGVCGKKIAWLLKEEDLMDSN